MKKIFTFCDLCVKKRLLGLLFLFLLCGNAFSQTVCRPVSQTNSQAGLLCIGLDVNSPTLAYDNDPGLTTYATLQNAVGLLCMAEETMTLNQTVRAGDEIVLYLGTGNGLLDVGLLSNVSIQTKLSGTDVGPRVALNSPVLNLSLLSGNAVGEVRYTVPGDANQVQIQVGGLLSLLVNLRIYDVRLDFAKPTVTGGLNQTICSGTSTTLTATPVAGTTLAWYNSASSTTALATGNTLVTPNLTANTTYYIGVTRAGGCEGNNRVPVVVNVSNPVAPAINSSGRAVCSSGATQQTTLSLINPIPGTTYNWYSTSSGGTILASGNSYSPTVPIGTTSFYVEAVIGSCISPTRAQVDVVSNPVPALATALTQSVTIQSGQNATLSATTSEVGVTLNWYDVATGGTAISTNTSTFTTPILTATKTYYVETQSAAGGCVSASRAPITVNVITTPLGGCLQANSQQTSLNGLCLLCSSTNQDNSVDGNIATAARLTVPVGLINGWIQQTLQFNNPGKAGDIIDVELELPGGVLDLSLLNYISLATYNGTTFNNDRISINNLVSVQLLGGNRFKASITAGANFDRVEVRLGGLATVLTSLDIYQASYRYSDPSVTGNKIICSGQNTTLTAGLAVGETVNWYSAATGGASLAGTAAFTTPNLTADTTYYAEITRNGCVNSVRFAVPITVNNPVAATLSPGSSSICAGQSTTITVQSPVAGTTYNWYDAATAGNLVFTGTSFTTPVLTGSTNYYVESVIGSCSSSTRAQASITVNPLPAVPTVASSTVIIPSGQVVTLQVSNPIAGVAYDWYDVATGGTALLTDNPSYTPSPALTADKTYYIAARSTSNCVSATRTAINVVVTPVVPITSCLKANSQVTSRGGLTGCLLCSSANDGFSVDANDTNFARLSVPVGLVDDYMQQMLTFSTSGKAGDIIDVELGIPGGIADVSALSYISLRSYNGGAPNSDQVNIGALVNVQLLGGDRFKASFVTSGDFTAVEVRLGGIATLLTNLDIYGASFRYKEAAITGASSPICSGTSTVLTASTTAGDTINWYDVASGGTSLATNTATYNTGNLTASKTYYIEAVRGGTCINSVRQPVTVTVLPLSVEADITIASPVVSSCAGTAVLAPTSGLTGAQFKYYTDQIKTQEITTGSTVAGQTGVTFSKDGATGALTISGLASGASYTYYIAVGNATSCDNAINTLQPVVVNFPATSTTLAVTSPLVACGSANLKNAITTLDTSGNTTYTFFDPSDVVMTDEAAMNVTINGVYSIQSQINGDDCPSAKQPVTVTVNPLPSLTVDPAQSVAQGTNVTLNATSNGTLAWYDPQGTAITGPPFTTGALNVPGIYTYTVVATLGSCSVTGTLSINVKDPDNCQSLTERVYATAQSSGSIVTGGVSNGTNAIDGNPQTFSTITTGVGLLGIGTTWQDLTWPSNIAKGTPVTIKLGSEYSGLGVAQGVSVIGRKAGVDIGVLQSVSGALLNVLPGDNAYEFTFVPSNAAGPQDYDGIRIVSGALLSVAQNTKVYEAYYKKSVTTVACTPGDIQDIFYGTTDLGLPVGALTSTVGVSDAWNIADNDVTTFATMYSGVGALAAADLTVQFKTPSVVSDTLRIVISKPAVLLNVNLLTGFTIQRYLGNVAVGAPIQNTSSLLSIKLLSANTMAMVLVSSPTESYDRVRIRFGGVAGVLEFLRVHTVERVANTSVIGGGTTNKVTVCPGSDVTLQIPEEACSTYIWYDAPTGGSIVANGLTYTVPANLASGTYKYYVQPVRYGCEAMTRGEVTVEVKISSPENLLTDITLNGATSTTICAPTGTVILATTLTATGTITNPVYHWYKFDGTTSQPVAGATASSLTVTGLTPGTYTYFVGFSSDEYCETAEGDRKQITFTILRPSDQNDLSVDDVTVCHDLSASLTPVAAALTNPVFTWYLDSNKTQPIADGDTNGSITYAISSTGVLTVSGLTLAMGPVSYYVAVSSDTTCENLAGTLQEGTITLTDPGTPTTTDDTQDFCLIDVPTVANIQVNEANVVWYSVSTGGTAIAPTTALADGIYYAAIKDPLTSCESSVRLAVTINVSDPGTPTTTDNTQDFCLVDAPTVANIQVNAPTVGNIVWYTALTGGTVVASTTALINGSYFAAIFDPATNCESATRLEVTVTVSDPLTPTTTDATQDFCLIDAPTVASIQVNETNVVWYSASTGGTAIASTTALASGDYYAAIKDPVTNCESSVRLLVTVTVSDPGTPTTADNTQDFCLVDAPTVASIQINAPAVGNIVWYTASTGGTAIASTTALASGSYFAAIFDPATNCESASRLEVAVTVSDPGTPTTTDNSQDFCLVDAPTVANIQVNAPTVGNIVWYTASTGGTVVASTTALTNGSYFAAIFDPATNCESASRLEVAVTVSDPLTPTTTDATQDFCLIDAPTVSSIQVNETNVVWYSASTGGTAIASTTALVSGDYYAAIKDPVTNCESSVRLLVTVTVSDPGTPTTADNTQDFCLIDAPTVASIQINAPAVGNIVWYTASTGGTAIASTTALASGSYFASIFDSATNCESASRLEVAVTVSDPGTPTTTDNTQDFCLVDAPTVANIQVNAPTVGNIVWYTALTGGTVVASTTALTNGSYFAAIFDPATNCESASRLEVAVTVSDPGTPTTTDNTQDFCLINAPTVASIQVNETNIVWYSASTGGTAIASTTALASGDYYAAIKDPVTNCESSVRLLVTVTVSDPGTPTTADNTQDFCLIDAPTVASIQINAPAVGNIVWYTASTGGTAIASTTALASGSYFASIFDPATNCESASRLEVAVTVSDPGTPTTTDNTQDFCLVNAPTFASIQVSEANVVWYTASTGGTAITSTTALTSGTYFGAIKDPVTGCESATRLQVAVTVTDPATPTTTDNTQVFCSGNTPTVASIQVNEANVVWYSTATGGTAIPTTTALTTGVYYGAIKDPVTGCESSVRLLVNVTVGNTINPTTNNASQNFCSTAAPTIASIQVNESNVVWFSTATGGTAIPSTTALTSGIYFGNIIDAATGCESSTRLQVTVTVTTPSPTPTTNNATQNFCTLNSPTVANIQVNEANVVWYSTAIGGTAIPATTTLVTGTYYGAVSSAIGCENPVRLAVVVNVNTPGVVTTPRTTQTFCLSKLPTLANILVNEPNVVWYSTAAGGTPLTANTQLTAGTYYAAALNNTTNGCEGATRLGVTIAFENDALVPITSSDDTPCVFQGVTYSIANGKSNYVWSVTNGTIISGGGTADGTVTISWSDIGSGQVKVTYINTCDETTTKTLNVTVATCSDLTITNTVSNPTPNFGEQITFTVTVNNVGQGNFINTIVSDLLPNGYELISSSTTQGTFDQTTQLWTIPTLNAGQSVVLTIVAEVVHGSDYLSVATIEISTPLDVSAANNTASVSVDPICLTVYNEFTPNNDGANDLFRIDCIESYPNNELKVYNRYGALVYSKQHYENDWNGTANVSGVISRGDMLPTGTYFYVIDIGDGTVKKGWLSIMR
ncbi:gliding motility-associated C-terminal domain-containing protein [Flavobacterium sp. 245]|uniref:Ig-like domain-containing protein n=1 Tax=Flavobacterium sp. 245 TaxID=2512115 RepID=UPI00105FEA91|nr:gliding motility-associated C-terminal domain-containing protein [Flavobacterium sp. 245]TDP00384.1 gliding motility-associated-like protein [Flavobacterium sp. 245]